MVTRKSGQCARRPAAVSIKVITAFLAMLALSANAPASNSNALVRANALPPNGAAKTGLPTPMNSQPPAGASQDWLSQVQKNIAGQEYNLSWQDKTGLADLGAAWQAPNRAHNLRTYFTPSGPRVVPRTEAEASWVWGLELVGYNGAAAPTLESTVPNGARIEYRRGGLVEWYLNDPKGLEQGFTIAKAPLECGSHAAAFYLHSSALERNQGASAACALQIDLAIVGNLRACVAPDGKTIEFLSEGGVGVIHYGALKATDASGKELPARMELTNAELGTRKSELNAKGDSPLSTGAAPPAFRNPQSAIRIVVDASNAAYPVTIDPLATSAAWTAESNQAGAEFGKAVATAGDVNGDGYSDVIVGAPCYDNGQTDEGRAFLYYGSPSGLSATVAWTAEGDQAGADFGSVATAGDVNGDGYSDVIVGAIYYDNGQTDEGRAYLYLGSASGLSATPAWTAEGDQDYAYFGRFVSTAGDVNGDGYSDVIVGAYAYDNGQTDEGRAYLYLGSASGLSATPAWTTEGDQDYAYFGVSVSTAGDVNGDGYGDVIVGAYGYDNGQTDEGRAYVYLGSASGLSATPAWTAESDQAGAYFGWSVSTAGDVNGDGYSDVIVGAHAYDNGQTDKGRAYVYHGSASGLSATANWTAEGDQADALFGWLVATAGDVNGDGYGDVIVGARWYDNGQTDEGRAYVYYGSASGLSATPNWTAESDQAGAEFGFCVSTAGDVNGDGYSDVIVGAYHYDNGETDEGRTFVYLGSASGLSATAAWTAESDQAGAAFGYSVSTAGDVNGDGYSDVIVGAPYYTNGQSHEGAVFLYLGSADGATTSAAWSFESDQADAGLGFGYGVASAGDVNGDGYADVLIGARLYDGAQTDGGEVFLFLGSPFGLSVSPAWTFEGDQVGAQLGHSMASAGDVNGDGYSDVIVGMPYPSTEHPGLGRALVFHGSASGLSLTPDWTEDNDQTSAHFGWSVATAGDVNGDGYADVIVGAPHYDNGQADEGRAYLYLGSASGLSATSAWTAESNQGGAQFGCSAASAGDVNGDGYADVIIGAATYDNGQTDEGRAFLYLGSATGLLPTASWTAESDQAGTGYGYVATAGDINGDGYADVIVGANGYTNGEDHEGRAFVYLGSAAGLSATPAWTAESNQNAAFFGTSVASAGDVNGDGYSDVIVGAYGYDNGQTDEGRAFLYYGNGEAGRGLSLRPQLRRGDDSAPIAQLAVSGSSARLAALGRTPYGRGKVKLEYEIKPLGTAFNSSGTVKGASWTDTGTAGAALNELASGLSGTVKHWRIRLLYDPATTPLQQASRWFTVPTNGWQEADFRIASGANLPPEQPSNVAPANGATGVSLTPTLQSSAFSDPDADDTHAASQWQVRASGSPADYSVTVFDSTTDSSHLTSRAVPGGALNYSTTYYWRVRHQDNHGMWSAWSNETHFATLASPSATPSPTPSATPSPTQTPTNHPPAQPSNVAPANGATGVSLTPTLQSSVFSDSDSGDTHAASQWQIRVDGTPSDYSVRVYNSGVTAANKTSCPVPASVLGYNTKYWWRVRHEDNHGAWSAWSSETAFTTAAETTPVAPNQPVNVSPANDAPDVAIAPLLEASPFVDANAQDTHAASQWQIRPMASGPDYSDAVYDSFETSHSLTFCQVPAGRLNYDTSYYWHVKHKDNTGRWSAWSAETNFTTIIGGATSNPPNSPTNLAPANAQFGVATEPRLEASPFSDPDVGDFQTASQWRLRAAAQTWPETVYNSGVVASNARVCQVAAGFLEKHKVYYWQVCYRDSRQLWSGWSPQTWFQTVEVGALPAPQGLRAAPGVTSVWLTWLLPTDPQIVGYNLYRANTPTGTPVKINTALIRGKTEYLDTGLPKATFYYRLTMVAGTGMEGAMTAPVSATVGATRVFMRNLRGLPGDTISQMLTVDNPNGLGGGADGMEVTINYDEGMLTPLVAHNTYLTRLFNVTDLGFPGAGQLRFLALGESVNIVGEGHVFELQYYVSNTAPQWAHSGLSFDEVLMADENGDPAEIDYTSTATMTVQETVKMGDVNKDGKVNLFDVTRLRAIIVSHAEPTPYEAEAGDINGDGLLDSADVVLLIRVVLNVGGGHGLAAAALERLSVPTASHTVTWGNQTNLGGARFSVDLTIDELLDVAGMDVVVNFNPALLSFVSVAKGPAGAFGNFQSENANGQLKMSLANRGDTGTDSGVIATLTFDAIGYWVQTPMIVANLKCSDEYGVNLARFVTVESDDSVAVNPASNATLRSYLGTVTDEDTDQPVAGAEVMVEGVTSQTGQTNASGQYGVAVWALDGSEIFVTAEKAGYERFSQYYPADTAGPINISLQPLRDWRLCYDVVYRRDGRKATAPATIDGIVITGGGTRDTLTIKRKKGVVESAVIPLVKTDGALRKLYTDAAIARLEVAGRLVSLTAKGCHVERVMAGEVGMVNMSACLVARDAATTPSNYAFAAIEAVGAVDKVQGKTPPALKPKILTSGVVLEGVATAGQHGRATIKAMTKKYRAKDSSTYLSYGCASADYGRQQHLRDRFIQLAAVPDDGPKTVAAFEIGTMSSTGGPIETGRIAAQGIQTITAKGAEFSLKTAEGATAWVFMPGDITPREIISGASGKSLSVSATGGGVRVGEAAYPVNGIATGGIHAGGGIASLSAKYAKYHLASGGYGLYGGVVGFGPSGVSAKGTGARVGVGSYAGPWMLVESGAKDMRTSATKNLDIRTVSGDLAVYGVFIAANDGALDAPNPAASIRLVKTRMAAPGWAAPLEQPWWFTAAGRGYSLNWITVKTVNNQFDDVRH